MGVENLSINVIARQPRRKRLEFSQYFGYGQAGEEFNEETESRYNANSMGELQLEI